LERLRQELPNLRLAQERALAFRDGDTAGRLTGALGSFWYHSGYFTEGRVWSENALPLCGNAAVREKVLATAGELAALHGDLEVARRHLTERFELCVKLGDANRLASAYTLLGHLAAAERAWSKALELYERALELDGQAPERPIVWQSRAVSLSNVGWALLNLGQLDAAQARLEDGLASAHEEGSALVQIAILNNLARVALARRDMSALRRYLRQSVSVAPGARDPHLLTEWFELAARLLARDGQEAAAGRAKGAADRLREMADLAADFEEEVPNKQWLDEARLRATPEQWAQAVEQGRAEASEDPIQLALDCLDQRPGGRNERTNSASGVVGSRRCVGDARRGRCRRVLREEATRGRWWQSRSTGGRRGFHTLGGIKPGACPCRTRASLRR
jgi:tetratricopeptide (TPR) repeat protein